MPAPPVLVPGVPLVPGRGQIFFPDAIVLVPRLLRVRGTTVLREAGTPKRTCDVLVLC